LDFFKGQIRSLANRQSGKHTAFDAVTMRICLAVCARSPKAYDYLGRLLALPSKRTLRRVFQAYDHGPGINEKVFENCLDELQRHGKHSLHKARTGCLQFDEVYH
jgi:hypothetical protein